MVATTGTRSVHAAVIEHRPAHVEVAGIYVTNAAPGSVSASCSYHPKLTRLYAPETPVHDGNEH